MQHTTHERNGQSITPTQHAYERWLYDQMGFLTAPPKDTTEAPYYGTPHVTHIHKPLPQEAPGPGWIPWACIIGAVTVAAYLVFWTAGRL